MEKEKEITDGDSELSSGSDLEEKTENNFQRKDSSSSSEGQEEDPSVMKMHCTDCVIINSTNILLFNCNKISVVDCSDIVVIGISGRDKVIVLKDYHNEVITNSVRTRTRLIIGQEISGVVNSIRNLTVDRLNINSTLLVTNGNPSKKLEGNNIPHHILINGSKIEIEIGEGGEGQKFLVKDISAEDRKDNTIIFSGISSDMGNDYILKSSGDYAEFLFVSAKTLQTTKGKWLLVNERRNPNKYKDKEEKRSAKK